jgi:hypothetical protein
MLPAAPSEMTRQAEDHSPPCGCDDAVVRADGQCAHGTLVVSDALVAGALLDSRAHTQKEFELMTFQQLL